MKTSKNIRYRENLWIKHRKRVYLYWFKFLKISIQEGRSINRQFYMGWGNLNLKFDDWWEKNWKKLFSMKKEGDIPLVNTSTTKVKANAYKHRLKVYELRKQELSHKEIVKKVNKIKGYNINDIDKSWKYMNAAKKHLKNVCKGKFP